MHKTGPTQISQDLISQFSLTFQFHHTYELALPYR